MATKQKPNGVFISFEGGDGSGKTTQLKLLADAMRGLGHEVVTTREPGGSEGAEEIRKLILEGDADRWSPMTEALLMYASRRDHLERTIKPALERGAIVITDRFADSTMAFQGIAGELGEEQILILHKLVVDKNDPDLTLIFDLPIEEGLQRSSERGGEQRFESKGKGFQENARQAFLKIAKTCPDRCAVIDARGDVADVAIRVMETVKQRLPSLF
ncbi:dTMP kinase [Hyphococcus flavus]|uniref:Thymidylate kinase n=1 Tax=Hyphococcus flavus TaxID=1866326 RepID=A0AAE9ZCP0_9PROT|nr:dTMP kinase [Hyphococcus flavus]WDI31055.1 dTMP kinase [Hyphococcus flavus]